MENPLHSASVNDGFTASAAVDSVANGDYITYPAVFPLAELELLGKVIIKQETDKKKIGHAVWILAGYALAQALGTPDLKTTHPLMVADKPATEAECHKTIQACCDAKVFPGWLLPIILELLTKLLEKK